MNLFNAKKMVFGVLKSVAVLEVSESGSGGDFRIDGLGRGGDFEKVPTQFSDFL